MFNLFFGFLLLFPSFSYASISCQSLFVSSEVNKSATFGDLSKSLTPFELEGFRVEFAKRGYIVPNFVESVVAKNMVRLLKALAEKQDPLLSQKRKTNARRITKIYSDLKPIGAGSSYFLLKVEFNSAPANSDRGESLIEYYFNGTSLFQSKTYRRKPSIPPKSLAIDQRYDIYDATDILSEKQAKFFVATLSDSNEIRFIDQGQSLLDALSDQVVLSRSMDESEADAWLGIDRSPHNVDPLNARRPRQARGRLHFALNYYSFFHKSVYQIQVNKTFLTDLYEMGFLQINTYEADSGSNLGMPITAFSKFGIPFEIVVLTGKGISLIEPHMKTMTRANP